MRNSKSFLVVGCCFFTLISFVFCFFFQDVVLFSIDFLTRRNFHGVILIETNNKKIFEKSTLKEKNPQFLCASLIKQITSALILREFDRGNLKLGDRANEYLDESQQIDDRIETWHLLSHSSGIQRDNSVKFEPGTAHEYSNYGYMILGIILENVTKFSFSELAQNFLLEQGMTNSFLVDAPTLPEIQQKHPSFVLSATADTSSFSYVEEDGKKIFPGNSCGGLISTAQDLSTWNRRLNEGEILPYDLYKMMIYPRIPSNFSEGYYGYGLCNSEKEIYHFGYVCGYKSIMAYFPKTKISLVILENQCCNDYEEDFRKYRWIRWLVGFLNPKELLKNQSL